ncbi:hypothetical protein IKG29_00145 [Candidatus Saccharibacteria bacterium]|nr:hypothetical protein [Candidatus Saccharibacteria bacterium]
MKSRKKRRFSTPQIIVLVTIIVNMFIVVTVLICSFIFKPEVIIKNKISELASDYYENYLYKNFDTDDITQEQLIESIQKYKDSGLPVTTLRQILLYDHQKNADSAPLLKKYCDENSTFIKFFPEYPYSKTSYRIEYTYSCEF